MFATAKDIYKLNDSILLWIVVDLFMIRWTNKTWKCLVSNLALDQLPFIAKYKQINYKFSKRINRNTVQLGDPPKFSLDPK